MKRCLCYVAVSPGWRIRNQIMGSKVQNCDYTLESQ